MGGDFRPVYLSLYLTFIIGIALFGCENKIEDTPQKQPDIRVEDGVLVFANQEVYSDAFMKITQMTHDEFLSWEQQIGFTSLEGIHIQAYRHDALLLEKYESFYGREELGQMLDKGELPENSIFTQSFMDKGILYYKVYEDGSKSLCLTCNLGPFTRLFGESKKYIVGDIVYWAVEDEIHKASKEQYANGEYVQKKGSTVHFIVPQGQVENSSKSRKMVYSVWATRENGFFKPCETTTQYFIKVYFEKTNWRKKWVPTRMECTVKGDLTWRQLKPDHSGIIYYPRLGQEYYEYGYGYTFTPNVDEFYRETTCRPYDPYEGRWQITADGNLTGKFSHNLAIGL